MSAVISGASWRWESHSWSRASEAGVVVASRVMVRPTRSATFSSAMSTCSLAIAAAVRVIDAVTFGLPSRSPPIHVPRRTKGGATGVETPGSSRFTQVSSRR